MDSNGDLHDHVIYHKQVWKFQPGQETFLNAEACCLSLHIFHETLHLTELCLVSILNVVPSWNWKKHI